MLVANVSRWQSVVQDQLALLQSADPGPFAALPALKVDTAKLVTLVLAVIQKESYGDPQAVGDNKCSYGLMQLNWCYHQNRGTLYTYQAGASTPDALTSSTQLLDPATNVQVGIRFLVESIAHFNSVDLGVLGYNGAAAVERYVAGIDQVPSNLSYFSQVMDILELPYTYFVDLLKSPVSMFVTALVFGGLTGALVLLAKQRKRKNKKG